MSTAQEEHRIYQLLRSIDHLNELGDWSQRLGIDRDAVQRGLEEVRALREAEEAARREAAEAHRQEFQEMLHAHLGDG